MKLCLRCSNCYDDTDFVCPADGQVLEHAWPDSRLIANKYQLESILARGGMGVIYRARQLELNREIAIKILSPQFISKERMVRQFHREALAVARLDHVNIVPIYDYGTLVGGGAYLAMRLVNGQQLTQEIYDKGALPIERTIQIIDQVCDGVSAAHAQQIVHCDLKPDNILLERTGNRELVQLVDFGIAKLRELTVDGSLHSAITESAIGTPQYMSPEQCCGEPITHHTDIYSLGIIVFEMLTGRVPFRSQYAAEIAKHHVRTTPPRPSAFNPVVSSEIDRVILRALGKRASERQDSVHEFIVELRAAAGITETAPRIKDLAAAAPATSSLLPITDQDTMRVTINVKEQNSAEAGVPPQPLTHTALPLVTMSGFNHTQSYFEPIDKRTVKPATDSFPNITALLIDGSADFFRNILREFDCTILIADDEQTAARFMLERDLHMVICNISLPNIDGWQIFSRSQELPFAPLFIFISDNDNENERLLALEQGAEDYWPKPFVAAELQIRLKRLLQRLNAEQIKNKADQQETEIPSIDIIKASPVEELMLETAATVKSTPYQAEQENLPEDLPEDLIDPLEDFEIHFSIGLSYCDYGFWQDAIEEFQQAMAILGEALEGKHNFRCCYEIGRCHQELGQLEEAYQWYAYSVTIPGFTNEDYQKAQQAIATVINK